MDRGSGAWTSSIRGLNSLGFWRDHPAVPGLMGKQESKQVRVEEVFVQKSEGDARFVL